MHERTRQANRHEARGSLRSIVRERRLARGSKRGRTRRISYLERRSHAVCAARETKRRGARQNGEILSLSLSYGARTPRDYKEEPLNRGPGPLQGIEVLPSWLNQQRCISTVLTPNPTTPAGHHRRSPAEEERGPPQASRFTSHRLCPAFV